MTSNEFILWLKGFSHACNDYAPTPKQWDMLKDELAKVSDPVPSQPIFPGGGYGIPNGDLPNWLRPPWTTHTTLTGTTAQGYPSGSDISFTNAKTQLTD